MIELEFDKTTWTSSSGTTGTFCVRNEKDGEPMLWLDSKGGFTAKLKLQKSSGSYCFVFAYCSNDKLEGQRLLNKGLHY